MTGDIHTRVNEKYGTVEVQTTVREGRPGGVLELVKIEVIDTATGFLDYWSPNLWDYSTAMKRAMALWGVKSRCW